MTPELLVLLVAGFVGLLAFLGWLVETVGPSPFDTPVWYEGPERRGGR